MVVAVCFSDVFILLRKTSVDLNLSSHHSINVSMASSDLIGFIRTFLEILIALPKKITTFIPWVLNTHDALETLYYFSNSYVIGLVQSITFRRLLMTSVLSAMLLIIFLAQRTSYSVYKERQDIPVAHAIISNKHMKTQDRGETAAELANRRALELTSTDPHTPISNFKLHKPFLEGSPVSPLTPGTDIHMDTESVHSLVSDDALSIISRLDQIDKDLPDIIRQSKSNPAVLVGWRISIKGSGTGVVTDIIKRWGMTTSFKIKFDGNKKISLLPLQRGPNKGTIPFIPITKVY